MSAHQSTPSRERTRSLARSHVEQEVRVPLFELADMRSLMESELWFSEGELTPAMEKRWDAIHGSAEQKLYAAGLWVCERLVWSDAIDLQIARLTERRRANEKQVERRKEFIAYYMGCFGLSKVEGPLCTIVRQRNSTPSVEILRTDPALTGPQADLFASRSREAHSTQTGATLVRGHHVMVR